MNPVELTKNVLVSAVACSLLFVLAGLAFGQNESITVKPVNEDLLPVRIAFGSCGHQDKPHPILRTIVEKRPDLFVYLGDNIYGDTKDMAVLKAKYAKLAAKPEFQHLRKNVSVLSVWDDHDYGWNDAGKEYPFKKESKEIFLDFWKVPESSARRTHEGIYGAHYFRGEGRTVQVLLLDTRTFRDLLKRNPRPLPKAKPGELQLKNEYQPDPNPNKTMLGAAQWKWLENELKKPADVRVVCSSIQFGHEYNGWESWTNLPSERNKMVDLIRETGAEGLVFVSGDVHWGEISRRTERGLYDLYDITASGLTEEWHNTEANKYRVGKVFRDNHFGMITIDWSDAARLTFEIIDAQGKTQVEHSVPLSDLRRTQNK